jgi:hypothetical protein
MSDLKIKRINTDFGYGVAFHTGDILIGEAYAHTEFTRKHPKFVELSLDRMAENLRRAANIFIVKRRENSVAPCRVALSVPQQ